MEDVQISIAQVIGLGLSGLVGLVTPFVMWIIWRKKTRAAWIPLIAGILGYLFAGAIHGVFRAIFLSGLQSDPWLFYLCQALSAAVTEEGARYLIFRFGIPNQDLYRDAVSYGIGHGGLEHVLVNTGTVTLYAFFVALGFWLHGMDAFAPGQPYAILMEGLDEAGTREIVQNVAQESVVSCVFTIVFCITGMLTQCCLSILVFTAVHYDLNLKWFAAALGLHMLADIIPAFHLAGDFSRTETDVLTLLFDIGVIYLTYRVWKHYRPAPEETELPLS